MKFSDHKIGTQAFTCLAWMLLLCGCGQSGEAKPEVVWGIQGISPGRLQKPRAIAIDSKDQLYIVDTTARIQVFDAEGKFLREWKTPKSKDGRPTGLSISKDGHLLVADTHYFRILKYTPEGKLLEDETMGGTFGEAPGEFGLVTDVIEDSEGNIYVSEYGDHDRIQKFSPKGKFLLQWGSHGSKPGQFLRPQNMTIDEKDRIWIADACNHRIQVFDTKGKLLFHWGTEGDKPGELYYPYDLALDGKGHLFICEYGNQRIQKFTLDGKALECWGTGGRKEGQLFNPWALVLDSQGRVHVLDSNNHRVQRVRL